MIVKGTVIYTSLWKQKLYLVNQGTMLSYLQALAF